MKADVLLGLQWGDEGKGKITDLLTRLYDVVARFQGGPNAGHTIYWRGKRYVLHVTPSGIFSCRANVIGDGVLIDPVLFLEELKMLSKSGMSIKNKILIAKNANLILPTHRLLDSASEKSKGKSKIGSTLRGIGPAYMDKTGRYGLRIGYAVELPWDEFEAKYDELFDRHRKILKALNAQVDTKLLFEAEEEWFDAVKKIKNEMKFIDCEEYMNAALKIGKKVLAEGAQGSMLDISFGTWPFVTSSNTTVGGVDTGLGIPANRIGNVIGIVKAYTTRVGSGPFITELFGDDAEHMRKLGNEYGATTGRERRPGWIDLPMLSKTIRINGVNKLVITKLDILDTYLEIKVCTHYKVNGKRIKGYPFDLTIGKIEPVYKVMRGWQKSTEKVTNYRDLPREARKYLSFIEQSLGVRIYFVSVGTDRNQIIDRDGYLK